MPGKISVYVKKSIFLWVAEVFVDWKYSRKGSRLKSLKCLLSLDDDVDAVDNFIYIKLFQWKDFS